MVKFSANPHFNIMKKLLIVSAVCLSTVALFSFRPKDEANIIMQENAQYAVNVGMSRDFVAYYERYHESGFDVAYPAFAGWVRAGVQYARAVWNASGKQAFRRFMEELSRAIPPFLQEGHYGLSAEDLATAEEIGLINRL